MRKKATFVIPRLTLQSGQELYENPDSTIRNYLNTYLKNKWFQGKFIYEILTFKHSSIEIDYTSTECNGLVTVTFVADIEDYEISDSSAILGEIIPKVEVNDVRAFGSLIANHADNKDMRIIISESDKQIVEIFKDKKSIPLMATGEINVDNYRSSAVIFARLPIIKPFMPTNFHITEKLNEIEKAMLLSQIQLYGLDKDLTQDELSYRAIFYPFSEETKLEEGMSFLKFDNFQSNQTICYSPLYHILDHQVELSNTPDNAYPITAFKLLSFLLVEYRKVILGIRDLVKAYGPFGQSDIDDFWKVLQKEKPKSLT